MGFNPIQTGAFLVFSDWGEVDSAPFRYSEIIKTSTTKPGGCIVRTKLYLLNYKSRNYVMTSYDVDITS